MSDQLYCVWYRSTESGVWQKSINCKGDLSLESAIERVTRHRLSFGPRKYGIFPVGFQPTEDKHYDDAETYGGVNSEKFPYKPHKEETEAIAASLFGPKGCANSSVAMVVPEGACIINVPKGYDEAQRLEFLNAVEQEK
jgi:hypothetical protein